MTTELETPQESTTLFSRLPQDDQPAQADANNKTFRTAQRTSNWRTNLFLVESCAVLALYLYALCWKRRQQELDNASSISLAQLHILASFGIIYMVRLNVMSRWLLKRELAVEEITFVILIWVPGILASYVFLAKPLHDDYSMILMFLAILLYILGSFLNSYSEYQRKVWKDNAAHKGRCYMQGLFAWSRNINYFGDSLLFAGWALATGNWWNAWAPLVMSAMFYFVHIPDKETYLQDRYANEWPLYKEKTPYAFIPFVC